jgi:hypothetical protein
MSNKETILGSIPVFGPGKRNTGPMGPRGGKAEFGKGGGRDGSGKKGIGKAPSIPIKNPPKTPPKKKKP